MNVVLYQRQAMILKTISEFEDRVVVLESQSEYSDLAKAVCVIVQRCIDSLTAVLEIHDNADTLLEAASIALERMNRLISWERQFHADRTLK